MRRRFRNPGGATSAEAIGVEPGSSATRPTTAALSASAIASGAIRYGRASFIARLLAKSPCSASAGMLDLDGGARRVVGERGQAPVRDRPVPGAPDRIADLGPDRGHDVGGFGRGAHGVTS